jgi:hypothetical protein
MRREGRCPGSGGGVAQDPTGCNADILRSPRFAVFRRGPFVGNRPFPGLLSRIWSLSGHFTSQEALILCAQLQFRARR